MEDVLIKYFRQDIATRLMKGEKIADYFASVSILFTDIVGSTPIAARMPARCAPLSFTMCLENLIELRITRLKQRSKLSATATWQKPARQSNAPTTPEWSRALPEMGETSSRRPARNTQYFRWRYLQLFV